MAAADQGDRREELIGLSGGRAFQFPGRARLRMLAAAGVRSRDTVMRTTPILVAMMLTAALALAGADCAGAQGFPDHLIKIVVPYPPAGPADVAARLISQPLSSKLGQSVVIENQPGAGGRTGSKFVAQAAADGYTLLLGGTNPNAIGQSLFRNLNFEPMKDFTAIALISFDSNALVVNPAIPAKNLQELVQYAKANPGKVSSGATVGIGPHVCLELFRVRSGTDIVFVPYKGAAAAVTDLLGNQIQISMTSKAVLLPLIKEGRLRALAVTSEERWPELPDVPTLHEAGYGGFPPNLYSGLLAPAHTPAAVIDKINAAVNEGLKTPELQASIAKLGLQMRPMSAAEFAAKLAEDARNWEAAVNESGVRID
jgi:tripartite-type tricarboxylate transporter receptor subunit TctC